MDGNVTFSAIRNKGSKAHIDNINRNDVLRNLSLGLIELCCFRYINAVFAPKEWRQR